VQDAVTVGATHWQDRIAWFSAREEFGDGGEQYLKPDVTAPGQTIASARAGSDGHAQFSGTSMATPHVAGVVALIQHADPDATPGAVQAVLEQSAVDIGRPGADPRSGYGRVDPAGAIRAARNASAGGG
jgi:serine protease AprX